MVNKQYMSNRTFVRWVASYLVILSLPILAVAVISLQVFKSAKREVVQAYDGSLSQFVSVMDAGFDSIHQAAFTISSDKYLHSLAYTEGAFTAYQFLAMQDIQKELRKFVSINPLLKEAYLYFPNNNYILSDRGHHSRKNFEIYFDKTYACPPDQLDGLLGAYHFNEMQNTQASSRDLLLLHSVLPSREETGRALLIFVVDHSALEEKVKLFESPLNAEYQFALDSEVNFKTLSLPVDQEQFEQIVSSDKPMKLDLNDQVLFSIPSKVQEIRYFLIGDLNDQNKQMSKTLTIYVASIIGLIILSILLALRFSWRHYSPLKRLTSFVTGSGEQPEAGYDEYDYIENHYRRILDEMRQAQTELSRRERLMRSIVLKRFLTGRFQTWDEADTLFDKNGINFSSREFIVASFVIRDDSELFFDSETATANHELIQVIIANIAEELINEQYNGYCTEIQDLAILIVSNQTEGTTDFADRIHSLCGEVAELTERHFNLKLCSAISAVHYDLSGVADAYDEVIEMSESLMVSDALLDSLTWDEFKSNSDQDHWTIAQTGQERCDYFVFLVRNGEYSQALAMFDAMFEAYIPPDLNNLALIKFRLFGLVNQLLLVFDDQRRNFDEIFFMELAPVTALMRVETVSDLKRTIYKILTAIIDYVQARQDSTSDMDQIDQIQAYIQNHYMDQDLSVAMIASVFQMNMAYLSRYFKQQTGGGMLDYIHETRIHEAQRLMAETNLSLKDISDRVGYYNNLTFIRAFKRQLGCTPGQFRENIQTYRGGNTNKDKKELAND